MISHSTITEIRESTRLVETTAIDIEALTQCGYSEDEIISLLWFLRLGCSLATLFTSSRLWYKIEK